MSTFEPVIGGDVIKFFVSPTLIWGANNYLGLGSDGPTTVKANVLAWIAPGPGKVANLVVQGLARQVSGATLHVTLCVSPGGLTPAYPTTALDASVINNAGSGFDAEHSFDVVRGDMIVALCSAQWAGGQTVAATWTPST